MHLYTWQSVFFIQVPVTHQGTSKWRQRQDVAILQMGEMLRGRSFRKEAREA